MSETGGNHSLSRGNDAGRGGGASQQGRGGRLESGHRRGVGDNSGDGQGNAPNEPNYDPGQEDPPNQGAQPDPGQEDPPNQGAQPDPGQEDQLDQPNNNPNRGDALPNNNSGQLSDASTIINDSTDESFLSVSKPHAEVSWNKVVSIRGYRFSGCFLANIRFTDNLLKPKVTFGIKVKPEFGVNDVAPDLPEGVGNFKNVKVGLFRTVIDYEIGTIFPNSLFSRGGSLQPPSQGSPYSRIRFGHTLGGNENYAFFVGRYVENIIYPIPGKGDNGQFVASIQQQVVSKKRPLSSNKYLSWFRFQAAVHPEMSIQFKKLASFFSADNTQDHQISSENQRNLVSNNNFKNNDIKELVNRVTKVEKQTTDIKSGVEKLNIMLDDNKDKWQHDFSTLKEQVSLTHEESTQQRGVLLNTIEEGNVSQEAGGKSRFEVLKTFILGGQALEAAHTEKLSQKLDTATQQQEECCEIIKAKLDSQGSDVKNFSDSAKKNPLDLIARNAVGLGLFAFRGDRAASSLLGLACAIFLGGFLCMGYLLCDYYCVVGYKEMKNRPVRYTLYFVCATFRFYFSFAIFGAGLMAFGHLRFSKDKVPFLNIFQNLDIQASEKHPNMALIMNFVSNFYSPLRWFFSYLPLHAVKERYRLLYTDFNLFASILITNFAFQVCRVQLTTLYIKGPNQKVKLTKNIGDAFLYATGILPLYMFIKSLNELYQLTRSAEGAEDQKD